MKKYSAIFLTAILIVTLFTGCGCRNSKPAETSMPTVPVTTLPTTQETEPSLADTVPPADPTIEDGNGPLPTNATAGADGDTSSTSTEEAEGRSRNMPRNTNPTTGVDNRTHRVMPQN